jgi:hypothetical protein
MFVIRHSYDHFIQLVKQARNQNWTIDFDARVRHVSLLKRVGCGVGEKFVLKWGICLCCATIDSYGSG